MRYKSALANLAGLLSQVGPCESPRLLSDDAWMRVLRLANEHLLGPLLHERLTDVLSDMRVPEDVLAYLAMQHRLNRDRNAVLRGQCQEIAEAFADQSIDIVFLKGAITLFEGNGPVRETRMMRDIDILVPPAASDTAIRILAELDYDILRKSPPGDHAVAELVRPGAAGAVDLHTELIDAHYLLPAETVRRRRMTIVKDGLHINVPAPSDRLLHHLLHAQIHHTGQFYRHQVRLDQVHDFQDIAARHGNAVDWLRVAWTMESFRLTPALHSYALIAGRFFGMSWPLPERPRRNAVLHARLTRSTLASPGLKRGMVPFGNLRRAFAWHRMCALYGRPGSTLVKRLRHLLQYVLKKTPGQVVIQLFRYE